MTVSLYCDEYVERIEYDRGRLMAYLKDAANDEYSIGLLELITEDLPPRRGAGKIQDSP